MPKTTHGGATNALDQEYWEAQGDTDTYFSKVLQGASTGFDEPAKGDDVSDGNSSSQSEGSSDKQPEKRQNDGPTPQTAQSAEPRLSKTAEAKKPARSTGGAQKGKK